MRTPSMLAILKKMGYMKPILDDTKWHSNYDMQQLFLELGEFCNDTTPSNPELHIPARDWEKFLQFQML
jgi:hypothetical protein